MLSWLFSRKRPAAKLRERCIQYASKNSIAGTDLTEIADDYFRYIIFGNNRAYYKDLAAEFETEQAYADACDASALHKACADARKKNKPITIDTSEIDQLQQKTKKADALIQDLKTILDEISNAKVVVQLT